jgi:hypothetical protein
MPRRVDAANGHVCVAKSWSLWGNDFARPITMKA